MLQETHSSSSVVPPTYETSTCPRPLFISSCRCAENATDIFMQLKQRREVACYLVRLVCVCNIFHHLDFGLPPIPIPLDLLKVEPRFRPRAGQTCTERHALEDMHSKTCTDQDVSWHQFEMWVTSTGLPFKSHELFFSLRMPPAAPEVLLAGACLLMFRRSSVTAQQSRILQGERACIWQKHATKRSHFCNVSWHVATNGAVSSCCQEAHCTC